MPAASYALNSRHLGFLFLIMLLLIFMMTILIFAGLSGNSKLILQTFVFIGLVAAIVIVLTLYRKTEFE